MVYQKVHRSDRSTRRDRANISRGLNCVAVAASGPQPSWGLSPGDQCSLAWAYLVSADSRGVAKSMLPRDLQALVQGVKTALMQIIVRDNNVDQALRALKKKLQREGVYREMKLRRHYEKPSERRARERAAAIRRARKLERKRAEREGVK